MRSSPSVRVVVRGAALAALVAVLPIGVESAGAAGITVTSHFVVLQGSTSVQIDLNNAATNNRPSDLLFVTPNYDVGGVCGCVYDLTPFGVAYNNYTHQWVVFNEGITTIHLGASFNVLVVPAAGSSAFVQTATTENTSGDSTFISSPLTNGKPTAKLQVTQNYDPNGSGGVTNDHNVGVWYDSTRGEWGIFNEDNAAMALGVSFNVMVGTNASNGGTAMVVKASKSNRVGAEASIANAETTGNPNNVVFVTQNWDPKGVGGTYNNSSIGVSFNGTDREFVLNESHATVPLKASFNLLIFGS